MLQVSVKGQNAVLLVLGCFSTVHSILRWFKTQKQVQAIHYLPTIAREVCDYTEERRAQKVSEAINVANTKN